MTNSRENITAKDEGVSIDFELREITRGFSFQVIPLTNIVDIGDSKHE